LSRGLGATHVVETDRLFAEQFVRADNPRKFGIDHSIGNGSQSNATFLQVFNPAENRKQGLTPWSKQGLTPWTEFVVDEVAQTVQGRSPAEIRDELATLGLIQYVRDALPQDAPPLDDAAG